MEKAIAATKEKRARLKARLTATARMLTTNNNIKLYCELTEVYQELLTVHYEYCELVDSADGAHDAHQTVGGLNLEQYFNAIDSTYSTAIKTYAASLSTDVARAVKQIDFLLSKLEAETGEITQYLLQEAESHLSQCRDLFAHSGSVQGFDANVRDQIQESIFSLGQAIYKHGSGTKTVHFDDSSSDASHASTSPHQSNNPSRSDISGHMGAQFGASLPRLESTRASLGGQGELNADTLTGAGNTFSTSASQGGGKVASDRHSDLSVVTAYDSGASRPVAFPLDPTHYQMPSRHNIHDDDVGWKRSSRFTKIPLPTFNGDRRAWAEFRSVWLMYAQHEYRNDTERAWALKACLKGEALENVRAVLVTQPGAYMRMMKRLDSFFCDVSLNIQSVTEEFQKLKPVGDKDLVGLVNFVNQVEMCYSQLGEVGQINSIGIPQIDLLVDLLPIVSRKDWMRIMRSSSLEQQIRPFSAFMSFLEDERDTCMKLAERQKRKTDRPVRTHATDSIPTQDNMGLSDSDMGKGDTVLDPGTDSCVLATNHNTRTIGASDRVCFVDKGSHQVPECKKFLDMNIYERIRTARRGQVCYRCFRNHRVRECKATTVCGGCGMTNHHTLLCKQQISEDKVQVKMSGHSVSRQRSGSTSSPPAVLLIQQVPVFGSMASATVFFDSGSSSSFITHSAAKRFRAQRKKAVQVDLTTTGNLESRQSSYEYEVSLLGDQNQSVTVRCYGLPEITGKVSRLDLQVLQKIFPSVDSKELQRQSDQVDILIGGELCGLHPRQEIASAGDHLKVLQGPFGKCLHGSHPRLQIEDRVESHFVHAVSIAEGTDGKGEQNHDEFVRPSSLHIKAEEVQRIGKFIEGETLGTELAIKCGNCKCGKCPVSGHTYSFREEQELELIKRNLRFDDDRKAWTAKYPWIRDPTELPDNYSAALATLRNTERTLKKDESWAKIYSDQIEDMVSRDVARKLSPEEIASWEGPYFYISHLAVHNPKSSSTPVRIVFNSSQLYKGVSLNSFLAKGPDSYLNDLLGVLLRWRENPTVIIGDIKKMYNSIFIEPVEQQCHRFLWRNLEDRKPDVYIIQRVNMGDRPAAAISSEAVYQTADQCQDSDPEVSKLLKHSTYVDDLVESVNSKEEAVDLAKKASRVLKAAGFTIKHWLFSREPSPRVDIESPPSLVTNISSKTQVLGVGWDPMTDKITFETKLNFSKKKKGVPTQPDLTRDQIPEGIPQHLTRRLVLEQTMKIYDPLGILSPFLLKAKILLRETWALKLGWDDSLPPSLRAQWMKFFSDMFQLAGVEYDRCLKPDCATGIPSLVILSDASDLAYGFSAYARWQLENGQFSSRLIFSKCRIAPLRKLATPQMELNAAVLSKRGRKVIEKEMRYHFDKVYQLVDSETVLGMLNKVSSRFKLFEGVRVGEIQAATNGDMSDWYWIKGTENTADWLTRGKEIRDLGADSEWWQGPAFLTQPEDAWNTKSCNQCKESSVELASHSSNSSPAIVTYLMDYSRFSTFRKYVWIIARWQHAIRSRKLEALAATMDIAPQDLKNASTRIIQDVQQTLVPDLSLSGKKKGKFGLLNPIVNSQGVWVVGNRFIRGNPLTVSPSVLPALLPKDHPLTLVLMREAHVKSGHRGRDVTLATFRQEYWTIQGAKLARKIVNNCQKCRIRDHKRLTQQVGQLPMERLVPGPPFQNVMLDFFGPYLIRGEAQARVSKKAYGIIFTDVASRAVHIEVACGYDTSSFLLALKRFTSIRGWPSVIFSDPGSQLVGADRELVHMWQSTEKESTYKTCADNGTKWVFGPADSPWHQGAVESLVKAAKRALKFAINDQRLTATELSTVLAETANLLNERPIGTLPSSDTEIGILTPNCLLIGRAKAQNPGGWSGDYTLKGRIKHVGQIVDQFWGQWRTLYAPTLMYSRSQAASKNLQVGDVVAIADANALRSQYRVGVVSEVYPGVDGVVRKAKVAYKNFRVGEKVHEYKGTKGVEVVRSVQRLALLVPVDRPEGSA